MSKQRRTILVVKADGTEQALSWKKLERSIRRAGASRKLAHEIARDLGREARSGMTTKQIHRLVVQRLRQRQATGAVVRYSLKDAMQRLGPAGYDFEKYVAAILRAYGYDANLPELLPGKCIEQEVDVVARKGKVIAMVECKYRNAPGIHVHLKDVMATWARYLDLRESFVQRRHRIPFNACWLVCNTKVSSDGTGFGECEGMRIIGWRYPRGGGLERMIEDRHLYPITTLRSLSGDMQEQFAQANLLLCHDVVAFSARDLSRRTRVPVDRIERVQREVVDVLKC